MARVHPRHEGPGVPYVSLLRSELPGVVWPRVPGGTSAVLAALVFQLEATQRAAPDVLAANQHRQLVVLAEHLAPVDG